jgi:capsular exopolysaccharide synthesis family protein
MTMNAISDAQPSRSAAHADGPPNLRHLFQILSRRRMAAVWMVVLGLALAALAAAIMDPRYYAEAVVLVDSRKAQVAGLPEVLSDLPTSDLAAVRSEMAMIKSTDLSELVIARLRLDQDPEFAIKPYLLPLARQAAQWLPVLDRFLPTEEEAAVKRRRALLDKVRDRLGTSNDGRSYNIQISFRSRDPDKAARIVNAFAEAYVEAQVDVRLGAARQASQWLENRLAELRDRVGDAERAAQDFREKSSLNKSMGATSISRELAELNANLARVRDDQARAKARVDSIRTAQANGDLSTLADVVGSPLIRTLRQDEIHIRQQLVELSSRYRAGHPVLDTLNAQLADIGGRIAEEMRRIAAAARNDLDVATMREANIERQIAELEARNASQLRADVHLRELERVADASGLVYETFLSRLRETSQEQYLSKADARVVSHATAPVRSRYPVPMILAAGLCAGVLAGVVLALLVDAFDHGFRTSARVEAETEVPVAGIVPLLGRNEGRPEDRVATAPDSIYAESVRSVAVALGLADHDLQGRVVLVSSAVPGEGKTTVVGSLGRLLAADGRRVLMIEADLRRPNLAVNFGVEGHRRAGLAGVLRGELPLAQAVVEVGPGLSCLPAGIGAVALRHLLGTATMRGLVAGLRPGHDVVLIDAPPAMALADPLLLAGMADQRVLVVQWGATAREAVGKTVELFRRQGTPLDAVVLNQVDLAKQARYDRGDYGYCITRYQAYYTA